MTQITLQSDSWQYLPALGLFGLIIVQHHYFRLLLYMYYVDSPHLIFMWSLVQGVCAILIFNKYTYFWQFAYLILLSMWKYTYFQPKWLKRQKLGNIWRNCLQLMKFLDISRIFCSFSYLKSYVLFKTEQK